MPNYGTLGRISARLVAGLYDRGRIVFTIKDVADITSLGYFSAGRLISELKARRIISTLKRGRHILIPQELGSVEKYIGNWYVAAREVVNSPLAYLAFYSALQHWGMLTQPALKALIVSPRRQVVPRALKDKLIIVYSGRRTIWGIKEDWVNASEKVRFSDPEKTVIDCLAYPRHCGGLTEIAQGIWLARDRLDYAKLAEYIKRYASNAVAKRLGYILEILEIDQPALIKGLKSQVKGRYDLFDPTLSKRSVGRNDWRLIDNVGREAILKLIRH